MPLSNRIVRIPVQLVDGVWELAYGGSVKVKDGTKADLHIELKDIDDSAFLAAVTAKRHVRILNEGAELRVALAVKTGLADELERWLVPGFEMEHVTARGVTGLPRFVAVNLAGPTDKQQREGERKGGLWLFLEGKEPRFLESGTVALPHAGGLTSAISLNHAFTLLSEKFEPWRKAHTGSVYERVFYRDSDGHWYPIGDLREKELAIAERAIAKTLWEDVEKAIGLRKG